MNNTIDARAIDLQARTMQELKTPAALMLPAGVRRLFTDQAALIADMAAEISALKGAAHESRAASNG